MILFKKIVDLQFYLQNNSKIGFVPTMGALHSGHLSLIEKSKQENDCTVCSIFVNPKQFNNSEDLLKYPVTIDNDISLLEGAKCDVLFLPSVEEIYPNGNEAISSLDFGYIGSTLEGLMRPGHFDGVALVVEKLLKIVEPAKMYLGLKDYQQVLIIRKMAVIRKLPVQIISCPTHRESDGLAMSSRNTRLSVEARENALIISKVLFWIRDNFNSNKIDSLIEEGKKMIENTPNMKLEYLEIRNAIDLTIPKEFKKKEGEFVVLIAAWSENVRLIDNVIIND